MQTKDPPVTEITENSYTRLNSILHEITSKIPSFPKIQKG